MAFYISRYVDTSGRLEDTAAVTLIGHDRLAGQRSHSRATVKHLFTNAARNSEHGADRNCLYVYTT